MKTYYLYHIPGSKIGVTQNLEERVHVQQGYLPGEYEILESSEDIDYISHREIELQEEFGYRKDRKLYKELFTNIKSNNMKINPTQQTTTFPCPVSKLKGNLMDNLGLRWETPQGYKFEITKEIIPWILQNARESMYTKSRSYVYNKALFNELNAPQYRFASETPESSLNEPETASTGLQSFDLIRSWAETRGLYDKGDIKTQYIKLGEEFGELGKAILDSNEEEIVDAIGDMVVVLTNLSHLGGHKIEECIDAAYKEIASRKGKMINGTFVKETL